MGLISPFHQPHYLIKSGNEVDFSLSTITTEVFSTD